jgi:hypothetical protein
LDFGFTTQEFIAHLEKTHSNIKLAAMIDSVYMQRVTRTAEFFPVSAEKFRLLRGIKGLRFQSCCTENEIGEIEFSEEFTKKYTDWMNDTSKTSTIHDPEQIFGLSKDQARLVNQGYFEYGEDRFAVNHMWIIKKIDPSPNMPRH